MTTPLQRYRRDLERPDFFHDPAQEQAVLHLEDLWQRLVAPRPRRWFGLGRTRSQGEKGLYMWGGVGRGKTYLMDLFFDTLPFAEKRRMHFHRFMQYVHQEMRQRQGEKNPLEGIARDFARQARVLCFDEFFVTDITDAMILGTLLEHLLAEGMTLVATSNIVPDGLYRDGLQRARFLPAIALLNAHTTVLNVDGGQDYRLRVLEQAELYVCPLGEEADAFMRERFAALDVSRSAAPEPATLMVEGRPIEAVRRGEGIVWFEFRQLCDGPRAQTDYIELARAFHTVLLSNVEHMGGATDDMARRFINMVDEFYDRAVKLIISAEAPIEDIYAGGRLEFEFERTRSRLLEMQSREYLAREHLA